MSSKRPGNFASLLAKKAKTEQQTAADHASQSNNLASKNRYLSTPVQPDRSLTTFLVETRKAARRFLPKETTTFPITKPFCEVEARLGILKLPFGSRDRRVTSSGPKQVGGATVKAFHCHQSPNCNMESGVSRTHFVTWTQGGLSEIGPITQALGVTSPNADANKIKHDLCEHEYVETVYIGYNNDSRVVYEGLHPPTRPGAQSSYGKMEYKDKLANMDLTIPAAPYDMRISLSAEKVLDPRVPAEPPAGWSRKRVKRRRSYTRRDKSIAWQIDVTEVTTSYLNSNQHPDVDYEIEMELQEKAMLQLVNEQDEAQVHSMAKQLAEQLWWILSQINPLVDVVDAEETLEDHPNKRAVRLALAQCGALKKFMDGGANVSVYNSPIGKAEEPSPALANVKFVGCMPVNFSRHNIEEVQRSPDNGYFLSEKTDGVRHFMIFTGDTVVLVDRAMRGKQPIPVPGSSCDPMNHLVKLIKPGTIFDGEVVMHRGKPGGKSKPRPIFIVFDVLANSTTEPILHLPFEERYRHLRQATFRSATCNSDMFAPSAVFDPSVALPLVRKNFVQRTKLDILFHHVREERGVRTYRNGDLHNHMTDGIIFQPNLPYVCGTDLQLLKWKYLDTVTIDVEIMPLRHNDDENLLRVAVLGDEGSMVDMTRHVKLPQSELRKLEADRHETGGRIAEVGFHPETGEWYYLTMRPDKVAPNHISTVLGTVLELAESLTTEELRYRMSVPSGARDNYRKDVRGMLKQMLDFQRRRLKGSK